MGVRDDVEYEDERGVARASRGAPTRKSARPAPLVSSRCSSRGCVEGVDPTLAPDDSVTVTTHARMRTVIEG